METTSTVDLAECERCGCTILTERHLTEVVVTVSTCGCGTTETTDLSSASQVQSGDR